MFVQAEGKSTNSEEANKDGYASTSGSRMVVGHFNVVVFPRVVEPVKVGVEFNGDKRKEDTDCQGHEGGGEKK